MSYRLSKQQLADIEIEVQATLAKDRASLNRAVNAGMREFNHGTSSDFRNCVVGAIITISIIFGGAAVLFQY